MSTVLNRGQFTDRSGALTAGSAAQQVMAANPNRSYLFFQNISVGDLWINFGSGAVLDKPSIKVAAGGTFVMENTFVNADALSIVGATTGQKFTAKEG